jgi:NADPH-dependent curcumin reductase CurA
MNASGKETVLLSQYRHDSHIPLLEEHVLVFTSPARLCLLWRGRVKAGERVLVTGASGGVGTSAVQMLSKLGCHVVAVTTSPAKVCVSMSDRASTVYMNAACEFRQA